MAQGWWFTQVGEPPLQKVRGDGVDLVKSTRSVEKKRKKKGGDFFTYLFWINLGLSGLPDGLDIISPC